MEVCKSDQDTRSNDRVSFPFSHTTWWVLSKNLVNKLEVFRVTFLWFVAFYGTFILKRRTAAGTERIPTTYTIVTVTHSGLIAALYTTCILIVHNNVKLWITRTRAFIRSTSQNNLGKVQGGIDGCYQTSTAWPCTPWLSASKINIFLNLIGKTSQIKRAHVRCLVCNLNNSSTFCWWCLLLILLCHQVTSMAPRSSCGTLLRCRRLSQTRRTTTSSYNSSCRIAEAGREGGRIRPHRSLLLRQYDRALRH